ncbi:MAG: YraN family protein, partial [Clostridia bacterium]|nr:YraN family protein [Clostridia bacterium]
ENGRKGEDIVAEFYEANGYTVICRNYRVGYNEIDIIAENDIAIVFSEVKTRTQSTALEKYGSAKSAVDKRKRDRLIEAAQEYLRKTENPLRKQPRMDVVEVYLNNEGNFQRLNYIRNAFRVGDD